jgi:hypothetical protein
VSLTDLIPLRYRLVVYAAAALVLIGAGVVLGLRIGEARLDAYKVAESKAVIQGLKDAAALTKAFQLKKDEALHAANLRAKKAMGDAAAVRAVNDGLRDQLSAADVSRASLSSLRLYTTTLSAVFGECTRSVEGLAGKATGHASDALTFEQSWPK